MLIIGIKNLQTIYANILFNGPLKKILFGNDSCIATDHFSREQNLKSRLVLCQGDETQQMYCTKCVRAKSKGRGIVSA